MGSTQHARIVKGRVENMSYKTKTGLILLCCMFVNVCQSERNFIYTDTKSDGEVEKRISYKDLTIKETSVRDHETGKASVRVHQLCDGEGRSIQLIIRDEDDLIECEYLNNDPNTVHDFITEFNTKVQELQHLIKETPYVKDDNIRNVSYSSLDESNIPVELQPLLQPYSLLKRRCKALHQNIKNTLHNSTHTTSRGRVERSA